MYQNKFNQGTENCKLIELVDGACVHPLKKAKIDGVHTWGGLEEEQIIYVLGFTVYIVQKLFFMYFAHLTRFSCVCMLQHVCYTPVGLI